MKDEKNNEKGFFDDWYPLILGMCIGVVFAVLRITGIVNFYVMDDFNDLLSAVVSFVSILIGLISLLITTVLVNEKNSTIVDSFLDIVGRNRFYKATRANIVSGILTAFFSVLLYFKQMFHPAINNIFFIFWIVSLMSFFFFTIKFTDLLLQLLIIKPEKTGKLSKTTPKKPSLSESEITQLDDNDCITY